MVRDCSPPQARIAEVGQTPYCRPLMVRAATYVALVLWSIVFWTTSFLWMLMGAFLTVVLLVMGFHYRRVHVWCTAPIFKRCVQISLTRLRLHYHPDFDPEERSVFAQNHINLLDGHIASWAIPHAFSGLMNAWQFKIPIYGWLMSLSKGIAVHKGRRDRVLAQISEAARARKAMGMSVLVFPEGHRSPDGIIHKFRRGVFIMARDADMSMVPVAVKGFYDVNRKGSQIFHPFKTVDVFVGPQFSTAGLSDVEIGEFADRMQEWVRYCVEHGRFPEGEPASAAQPSAAVTA